MEIEKEREDRSLNVLVNIGDTGGMWGNCLDSLLC